MTVEKRYESNDRVRNEGHVWFYLMTLCRLVCVTDVLTDKQIQLHELFVLRTCVLNLTLHE